MKDKPYFAEEFTEHTQTLIDGTHLVQHIGSARYYRDSQGRVRTERSIGIEPDAFVTTTIDDPSAAEDYYLDVARRTDIKGVFPSNGLGDPASLDCPADPSVYSALDVRTKVTCETLGKKDIDGIPAAGIRITSITPVGTIGNDRPVANVMEKWTAVELKIVLLTKITDPRTGETMTRITKISRTVPDPALLRVPADYRITERPRIALPQAAR